MRWLFIHGLIRFWSIHFLNDRAIWLIPYESLITKLHSINNTRSWRTRGIGPVPPSSWNWLLAFLRFFRTRLQAVGSWLLLLRDIDRSLLSFNRRSFCRRGPRLSYLSPRPLTLLRNILLLYEWFTNNLSCSPSFFIRRSLNICSFGYRSVITPDTSCTLSVAWSLIYLSSWLRLGNHFICRFVKFKRLDLQIYFLLLGESFQHWFLRAIFVFILISFVQRLKEINFSWFLKFISEINNIIFLIIIGVS